MSAQFYTGAPDHAARVKRRKHAKRNCCNRAPELTAGKQSSATISPFGSQPSAAFGFAGLFVIFPATHLFFDTAPLDQFAETADRLLNRFAVTNQ